MREAVARVLYSGLLITVLMACRGTFVPHYSVGNRSGVNPALPTQRVQTFTDVTETVVQVRESPERIVCLHLMCIDILAELDLEPVGMNGGLVEMAMNSVYFGDRARSFGQIGGHGEPNLEQLLILEPDVTIGHQIQLSHQRQTLETITPLYLMKVETYTEAVSNLQAVGKMLGSEEKAEAAAWHFLDKFRAYRAKSPRTHSVMVMQGSPSRYFVATNQSLVGSTLAELTPYPWRLGYNSASAINWTTYSFEEILSVDPDFIFIINSSRAPDLISGLKTHRLWQTLTAVKRSQVFALEEDQIGGLSSGTRSLGQLLDDIMTTMYPDVFPEPLP
ncbi:ABC transporter substrate-binding protein [Oscillatoria acuminata]|uniref:ABC-type Fe3+-hydroxamate transport system, periplasmic component n=1 Tax=Oscillatoria acuminata PCC 6304 TaxID=56110 RepID=K9TL16_9CYAN|nr:ABC transporter substrate-binding protein [Oscillatoria acuminata]AFY82816.1 ABC-type Fe3+-hydroxamate transport system, periplasmic component [Oscillatoria acuminata PCC 6304]